MLPSRVELAVTLGTVYIDQKLAEALGWDPEKGRECVQLTLSGWAPNYFAITAEGTDADLLARGTVESSKNPVLLGVLEDLKER
ncbi:hypothetical protein AURDEDRAFT_165210 [Auricularia subglabra TFB-10046 SS5]|nr:hypothetical protein AURDEDRAFT_165210 [Auricularia subglabra TFB-10046 SS5]